MIIRDKNGTIFKKGHFTRINGHEYELSHYSELDLNNPDYGNTVVRIYTQNQKAIDESFILNKNGTYYKTIDPNILDNEVEYDVCFKYRDMYFSDSIGIGETTVTFAVSRDETEKIEKLGCEQFDRFDYSKVVPLTEVEIFQIGPNKSHHFMKYRDSDSEPSTPIEKKNVVGRNHLHYENNPVSSFYEENEDTEKFEKIRDQQKKELRSAIQLCVFFLWMIVNNSYFTWLMVLVKPLEQRNSSRAETFELLFLCLFCLITWFGGFYAIVRCILRILEMPIEEDILKNYRVPKVDQSQKRKQLIFFSLWSVVVYLAWFLPTFFVLRNYPLSDGGILMVGIIPFLAGLVFHLWGWHQIRLRMFRKWG